MKEEEKKNKPPLPPPIICGRPAHDASRAERPIPSGVYPVIDTDLGRDNVENDLPAADLTELR